MPSWAPSVDPTPTSTLASKATRATTDPCTAAARRRPRKRFVLWGHLGALRFVGEGEGWVGLGREETQLLLLVVVAHLFPNQHGLV